MKGTVISWIILAIITSISLIISAYSVLVQKDLHINLLSLIIIIIGCIIFGFLYIRSYNKERQLSKPDKKEVKKDG